MVVTSGVAGVTFFFTFGTLGDGRLGHCHTLTVNLINCVPPPGPQAWATRRMRWATRPSHGANMTATGGWSSPTGSRVASRRTAWSPTGRCTPTNPPQSYYRSVGGISRDNIPENGRKPRHIYSVLFLDNIWVSAWMHVTTKGRITAQEDLENQRFALKQLYTVKDQYMKVPHSNTVCDPP